jgi:hypothetical protein
MSHARALASTMRRLLTSRKPMPAPLDQETADRLLAGRLDPADAPPGYGEVARLLAAASAPPAGDELASEQAVLAAFAARSHTHPPELSPPGRPSRWSGGKAALVVAVALLMIGGVAVAATGRLQQPPPAPAHQAALTSQPRATLSRPSGAAATAPSAAAPATTRPPPTTTAATTPTSSTPPSSVPLGLQAALADLTKVITTGQRQGTVDPDADDLVDQAHEIADAARTGRGADARDQLDDLEHKAEELITSGKVRGAAVGRLRQALAHFSTAVVLTSRAGSGDDQQEEQDDDEGAPDQEPEDDSEDD